MLQGLASTRHYQLKLIEYIKVYMFGYKYLKKYLILKIIKNYVVSFKKRLPQVQTKFAASYKKCWPP